MFESYSADHTYYQLIIYADKQMIIVKCCNAPQDDPLSGVEKCIHHGDTLEIRHFLCAPVYIPTKNSIAKHAFLYCKEFYKSSSGLLLKPKFSKVMQSLDEMGKLVCSRILTQK